MMKLGRIAVVALAVLAAGSLTFAGETQVAQGKVASLSGKNLTVVGEDGAEWTFEVVPGAQVIAEGASHKSEALVSAGRKTVLDDFVREGHAVTVYYSEENGTRYARRLRVR
jgi:hypothetical protein